MPESFNCYRCTETASKDPLLHVKERKIPKDEVPLLQRSSLAEIRDPALLNEAVCVAEMWLEAGSFPTACSHAAECCPWALGARGEEKGCFAGCHLVSFGDLLLQPPTQYHQPKQIVVSLPLVRVGCLIIWIFFIGTYFFHEMYQHSV